MAKIKINTYILPSYWASALINGDYSGMEDGEEKILNEWIKRVKPGYCVGCSEESWFQWGHDANRNQGSDVLEYIFHK
jgi:hypothetical protein